MGFSIAAGLAGAAKRGMQYNDEQRKLLNENIQAAVQIGVTDAMEQRKARKQLETSYTNTATKLKAYKLSDAQIEAVYAKYGNSAPEEIAAALADASAQHALKNRKNGITDNPWTVKDEQDWLQGKFSLPKGVTPDMVQGRSTAEQARAFTDVNLPLTMVDPTQMAKSLAAGSGEISIRGGAAREQAIANQMSGMLSAGTGGMQESGPATFGNQYGFSLGSTSKDVNEAALAAANLKVAESAANVADEMNEAKVLSLQIGNDTAQFNLESARAQHPKQMEKLDLQIENLGYKNITDMAQADSAHTLAALNIATADANLQGKLVANTIAQITADNEEERQRTSLDLSNSQFEGQELANQLNQLKLEFQPAMLRGALEKLQLGNDVLVSQAVIKEAEAGSAEALQAINIAMQGVLLENNKIRRELLGEQVTAAENKNALAGLEKEQLEATIANLEARTAEIGKPTTFKAALVEITGAINEIEEARRSGVIDDVEYNNRIAILTDSQSRYEAGLIKYTAQTDTSSGTAAKPISFPSLVNGYNKGLLAKLSAAGINLSQSGQGFTVRRDLQGAVTGISYNREELAEEVGKVVDAHNSTYKAMLEGETYGQQVIDTLFNQQVEAAPAPETELPMITFEEIDGERRAVVPQTVGIGDRVQAADGSVRIYNGPDANPQFSLAE